MVIGHGGEAVALRLPAGQQPVEDGGKFLPFKFRVQGTKLEGWLDGKLNLEYTLKEPVSGKVGLWSKTDSMTEFSDFTVTPEAK